MVARQEQHHLQIDQLKGFTGIVVITKVLLAYHLQKYLQVGLVGKYLQVVQARQVVEQ